MDARVREAGVFVFGRFSLDPVRRTLTCDQVPVSLTARLLDTLLYLVQNQERVVPKEELERAVWGGRNVESTNVAVAISSLRKELHDNDAEDPLIATVPGQGYQIRAVVSFRREPDSLPPMPHYGHKDATTGPTRKARSQWSGATLPLIALLTLAATGTVAWEFVPFAKRNTDQSIPTFAPPPHSVAVMAFANISGDPSQDYFSDGISDELINALGQLGKLHVVARSSAFSFKGKSTSVQQIARHLGVSAVVEGSVRRQGTRLIIKAEMRDGLSGGLMWSETYDRDGAQILQVQESLAQAVASGLQETLGGVDAARLMVGGTSNPKALDAYLRALAIVASNDRSTAAFQREVAFLEQAISLDPNFATAEADLATVLYNYSSNSGSSNDLAYLNKLRQRAKESAEKAVALAPLSALGHVALSFVSDIPLPDIARQEAEAARARDLAPGNSRILSIYAQMALYAGHTEVGIEAAEKAAALNPLSPNSYYGLALNLYLARRPGEAMEAIKHAQELGRVPPSVVNSLTGLIALSRGDMATAQLACAGTDTWQCHETLAVADYKLGSATQASAELAKLHDAVGDSGAFNYAEIYAQWGRSDDAFHWLETAYTLRDTGLTNLRTSFFLDPIRNTHRFKDIETRLDFPP